MATEKRVGGQKKKRFTLDLSKKDEHRLSEIEHFKNCPICEQERAARPPKFTDKGRQVVLGSLYWKVPWVRLRKMINECFGDRYFDPDLAPYFRLINGTFTHAKEHPEDRIAEQMFEWAMERIGEKSFSRVRERFKKIQFQQKEYLMRVSEEKGDSVQIRDQVSDQVRSQVLRLTEDQRAACRKHIWAAMMMCEANRLVTMCFGDRFLGEDCVEDCLIYAAHHPEEGILEKLWSVLEARGEAPTYIPNACEIARLPGAGITPKKTERRRHIHHEVIEANSIKDYPDPADKESDFLLTDMEHLRFMRANPETRRSGWEQNSDGTWFPTPDEDGDLPFDHKPAETILHKGSIWKRVDALPGPAVGLSVSEGDELHSKLYRCIGPDPVGAKVASQLTSRGFPVGALPPTPEKVPEVPPAQPDAVTPSDCEMGCFETGTEMDKELHRSSFTVEGIEEQQRVLEFQKQELLNKQQGKNPPHNPMVNLQDWIMAPVITPRSF
jgi:hypothetical protein